MCDGNGGGGVVACRNPVATGLPPAKSFWPVSASYNTHPSP